MSGYGSLRKRNNEPQQPERDPAACWASNCPCKGSISLEGGHFVCTAHSAVPADQWPRVTEKLREHDWLIALIDDIARFDRNPRKDAPTWRDFATQFWQGTDDYCIPHPKENAGPYGNRLRGELLHRCGVLKTRPAPRLPAEPVARFGNAGGLLGRRAA